MAIVLRLGVSTLAHASPSPRSAFLAQADLCDDVLGGVEELRQLVPAFAEGILIKAAEQGYITQLACMTPECFCPEELGGACYVEPVTDDWSDWRSDWMPTVEHFPVYRKDGGKETVDNVILAHRLCNRLDHSLRVGRSHGRDLERIRKAREEGIRRNNVRIGNTEGGEIPTVEAEAATPTPKRTKKTPE